MERKLDIIGVQLDLGAARKGVDMGPLAIRHAGLAAKLVLQVHDELIVECPEAEAETVKTLVAREMEAAATLAVPLTAEAKSGKSWYEAK